MFKRKLKALDFPEWDKVNINDQEQLKKVVVWLEDQKIRQYRIEDRQTLQNIQSNQWQDAFEKYLEDVGCPFKTFLEQIDYLIGLAVQLEFEDNIERFQPISSSKAKKDTAPSIKSSNPLDSLDFQSNEFKQGVNSIAKLLNVPRHPDHLVTLEACSKLVCKRLNPSAIQNPNSVIIKGKPFPIMETNVGFNMGDNVLNNGAKVLSLLYIQDLRELQTKINEAIVSVQNITANPKTDTKLGKVGR